MAGVRALVHPMAMFGFALFPALAAQAPGVVRAPSPSDDPPAIVREATLAVEGDSIAALRARLEARRSADSLDLAVTLGLATVARLSYDYPAADRLYRSLTAAASTRPDRFVAYRVGNVHRGGRPARCHPAPATCILVADVGRRRARGGHAARRAHVAVVQRREVGQRAGLTHAGAGNLDGQSLAESLACCTLIVRATGRAPTH